MSVIDLILKMAADLIFICMHINNFKNYFTVKLTSKNYFELLARKRGHKGQFICK